MRLAARVTAVVLAALPLVAVAGAEARVVKEAHPIDTEGLTSPGRIPDLGADPKLPDWLRPPSRGARTADHWGSLAAKAETYVDPHGHRIQFATDNPGVDLERFANILVAAYHHGEIELVHVFVTSDQGVGRICGPQAVACYIPDDPQRSYAGVMILSYEDSDIVHTAWHEYGHHVDNQLYNLGAAGGFGCSFSNDGSRRWFFARDVENRILEGRSCNPDAGWERLFGELYAEDYAQLAGLRVEEFDPRMGVPPPNDAQKQALKTDMDAPFVPQRQALTGRTSRTRKATEYITTVAPSFLGVIGRSRGVRRVGISGCDTVYTTVFDGRCRLTIRTRRPRTRYRIVIGVG